MATGTLLVASSILIPIVAYFYQSHWIHIQVDQHSSNGEGVPCSFADNQAAIERFSKFLTFNTISDHSRPYHIRQPEEFNRLWEHAEAVYPTVWSSLTVEKAGEGGYSRLLTWAGTDTSKKPVLFISHVDVVPVQPENLDKWTHPPFSGAVADGFVWGRGSMDVKVTVVAMLEAITHLLKQGYQPSRTLMFAYGHDEEVGGQLGAGHMSELLKGRVGELEVVLDEGTGVIVDGFSFLAPHPIALVSTAEKGMANVDVVIEGVGGHSSMPPYDGSTVIEVASKLVAAVSAPPTALLQPPMTHFLQAIAPSSPMLLRPLLAHSDKALAGNVMAAALTKAGREVAALVRNTAVATRLTAGVADNVIPSSAHILFNFRTLPGYNMEDMENLVRGAARSLGPLPGVNVTVRGNRSTSNDPSSVVAPSNTYFKLLKQAIQQSWEFDGKPVAVAPFLLSGGTDSKHFGPLSRNGILRFMPLELNISNGDVRRVHGIDERIGVENFGKAVCAYVRQQQLFGST